MNYLPLIPETDPLAGRIELLFALDGYQPDHPRERVVPDGAIHVIVELDGRERFVFDPETGKPRQRCIDAWISGVHSDHFIIGDTSAGSSLIVAQFAPGHAGAFLGCDIEAINDRVFAATELLGDSILQLRKAMLEIDDAAKRLEIFRDYWAQRYDAQREAPAAIVDAVGALRADPGATSIDHLCDQVDVSRKHLGALFKRHVGPTPKRFQRILRFHRVFAQLQQQQSIDWATLSLDLGYADQAHFVRDFVRFSGLRPQEFLQREEERTNFFPEDER